MSGNQCEFELTEQPCVECGKPSGEIGTCIDVVHCPKCRQMYIDLIGEDEARELFASVAEYPARRLEAMEGKREDDD